MSPSQPPKKAGHILEFISIMNMYPVRRSFSVSAKPPLTVTGSTERLESEEMEYIVLGFFFAGYVIIVTKHAEQHCQLYLSTESHNARRKSFVVRFTSRSGCEGRWRVWRKYNWLFQEILPSLTLLCGRMRHGPVCWCHVKHKVVGVCYFFSLCQEYQAGSYHFSATVCDLWIFFLIS